MSSHDALSQAVRAALLFASILTAPVFASSAPMSDLELVQGSSLVVDANVHRLTPHWNDEHSLIFTTVDLDVSRTLYSRRPSAVTSLQVEVLGGEVGGVGLVVTDTPTFRTGERVLVFARTTAGGRFTVAGGPSGVLGIDAAGIVAGRAMSVERFGSLVRSLAK
jgi:hypothetical protein